MEDELYMNSNPPVLVEYNNTCTRIRAFISNIEKFSVAKKLAYSCLIYEGIYAVLTVLTVCQF